MELKLAPYQLINACDPARSYEHNHGFIAEAMSFKTPDNTIMVRRVPGHPGTLIELHTDYISGVLPEATRARPWFVHYAIVAGGRSSSFPVDMLRFDQCVPVNFSIKYNGERHIAVIDQPENNLIGEGEALIVAQTSQKRFDPFTHARWGSFLWGCRQIVTEELATGRRLSII